MHCDIDLILLQIMTTESNTLLADSPLLHSGAEVEAEASLGHESEPSPIDDRCVNGNHNNNASSSPGDSNSNKATSVASSMSGGGIGVRDGGGGVREGRKEQKITIFMSPEKTKKDTMKQFVSTYGKASERAAALGRQSQRFMLVRNLRPHSCTEVDGARIEEDVVKGGWRSGTELGRWLRSKGDCARNDSETRARSGADVRGRKARPEMRTYFSLRLQRHRSVVTVLEKHANEVYGPNGNEDPLKLAVRPGVDMLVELGRTNDGEMTYAVLDGGELPQSLSTKIATDDGGGLAERLGEAHRDATREESVLDLTFSPIMEELPSDVRVHILFTVQAESRKTSNSNVHEWTMQRVGRKCTSIPALRKWYASRTAGSPSGIDSFTMAQLTAGTSAYAIFPICCVNSQAFKFSRQEDMLEEPNSDGQRNSRGPQNRVLSGACIGCNA